MTTNAFAEAATAVAAYVAANEPEVEITLIRKLMAYNDAWFVVKGQRQNYARTYIVDMQRKEPYVTEALFHEDVPPEVYISYALKMRGLAEAGRPS